jgi:DNA-binding NtrC family response regulator
MRLPALRERKEDILPLTEFLLGKYVQPGQLIPPLTRPLRQQLLTYHWPGNVRELENVIRQFLTFGDSELIVRDLRARAERKATGDVASVAALPAGRPTSTAAPILEQVTKAKEQAEIDAILAALHATRWNRKKAASLLKIDYKALLYKMKKLSIEGKASSFRGDNTALDATEPPAHRAKAEHFALDFRHCGPNNG